MRKFAFFVSIFFILSANYSLGNQKSKFSLVTEKDSAKYSNPVVKYSLPDPTVIKSGDGYFYLYATEDIRNTPIHKSKNLVDWEFVGTAFTKDSRPSLEPRGGI